MDVLESYFLLCLVELYCFLVSCHEHFSVLTRQADSSVHRRRKILKVGGAE